jgi:hypothetical protein
MRLDGKPGKRPDGPDNDAADADVRNKMTVHHIDVDHIHPGILTLFDLVTQVGEIGTEDTGAD